MKLVDRIILALYALLVAVLSVVSLLIISGWTIIWDYLGTVSLNFSNNFHSRIISGTIAGFILVISLIIFLRSFQHRPPVQAIIRKTPLGDLRITLTALENLVVRAAYRVKGVREVKPRIKSTAEGVAVFLRVIVSPDANIPAVSTELQETVKDYVRNTAGIEVLELSLLVDNISRESHPRVE